MSNQQNILVIYDRLNSDLEYCITTDQDFLEFNGVKINGHDTPPEIQDKLSEKLFKESGEDKIVWTLLSSISSDIVKSVDRIVTIAFLP